MTPTPARAHVVRREPDGIFRVLTRGLLLLGWCSLLWGTLLSVSLVAVALTEGLGVALQRLDPRGRSGGLPWINATSAVLAPLAWITLALLVGLGRRARSVPPAS